VGFSVGRFFFLLFVQGAGSRLPAIFDRSFAKFYKQRIGHCAFQLLSVEYSETDVKTCKVSGMTRACLARPPIPVRLGLIAVVATVAAWEM
jgi:hypothetical protein